MRVTTLKIHKEYGAKDIKAPIKSITLSNSKNKKYTVELEDGKKVHFGDIRYEHYKDRVGNLSKLDHKDKDRRHSYLARATKIRNKSGKLTVNDYKSPNFYSVRLLW